MKNRLQMVFRKSTFSCILFSHSINTVFSLYPTDSKDVFYLVCSVLHKIPQVHQLIVWQFPHKSCRYPIPGNSLVTRNPIQPCWQWKWSEWELKHFFSQTAFFFFLSLLSVCQYSNIYYQCTCLHSNNNKIISICLLK